MISSLAYLGFTSPRAAEWQQFGPEILGLEVVAVDGDGTVRMRNDDALQRLVIHPGEVDDVAYIGWETNGPDAFSELCIRVSDRGVNVRHEPILASDRGVCDLAWFIDPFGFRHEMVWGLLRRPGTFRPGRPVSGFVTGSGGMGHAVVLVPELEEAERFYVGVLGFTLSDGIAVGQGIRFLHCNPRHHTLAFAAVPGMVGFHHLMLEVASIDDVGRALDTVAARGTVPLTMTLGRHTNDHMISFYIRGPSGFDIEYGTGGVTVPEGRPWVAGMYDAMSIWGHHPSASRPRPGILRPYQSRGRT